MKINEKNLCVFATTPPFDLDGYLNKRGEVNKSWQKRYFVLKGNLLFYFEKKGDKEPLGLIIVEGCTIELAEEGEPYSFQIVFNGNRTYTLCANSQDLMELWMKALTCAGYEYKKLMIAELQRQLDELEILQKKQQLHDTIQPILIPKPPPRRQNPFNRPAPPPPASIAQTVTACNTNKNDLKDLCSASMLKDVYSNNSNCNMYNSMTTNSSSCIEYEKNNDVLNNDRTDNGSGDGGDSSSSSLKSSNLILINDKDINFKTLHMIIKRDILEDYNNYQRKIKENENKLLIEF